MTAWTSPREMPREMPFRISRCSTVTRRSLMSKSANFLPLVRDVVGACGVAGPHPGGADHRGAQQALVEGLLLVAGMPGPGGDILDRAVAVPDLEATVRLLEHLGHVAALARQTGQLPHT